MCVLCVCEDNGALHEQAIVFVLVKKLYICCVRAAVRMCADVRCGQA